MTVFVHFANCLTQQKTSICLKANNRLRALHRNTPPLEWDDSIAAKAQQYAEHLLAIHQGRTDTKLVHDPNKNGLGENLYWSDNAKPGTCPKASLSWYNEIADYDYATTESKNGKKVGHFTQLVWRNSLKFGVGIATGTSRRFAQYGNVETFVVAKYSPQGNFHWSGQKVRDYTANVRTRVAGAVTPSIEELDPASFSCENKSGDSTCNQLIASGYKCNGQFLNYFKENCYKKCRYC